MSTSDELLAIRCQLGEPEAFDALIARWHEPLWHFARRVTGSDDAADDVVQDVWMHIVRGMPKLRQPERLRSWMFGIAHRRLMDRFRHRYTTPDFADINIDDLPASVNDDELAGDIDRMLDALAELPVVEREVLALFYLQELTLQQIADALDVPQGTVKSRLFRARRLLRERLGAAHTGAQE